MNHNSDMPPLAQRVAALRRDHILDAAIHVFASKGFERTTIRDVARRAGVSDGTIYNYFENKSALLLGILDRVNETERRSDDLSGARYADFEAFLSAYIRHRFDVLASIGFPALHVLLSELLVNTELRDRYRREVLEPTFALADTGATNWPGASRNPKLDPRLVNRAVAGAVFGVLMLRLLGEPVVTKSWNEMIDVVSELILRGIGVPHANGDTS